MRGRISSHILRRIHELDAMGLGVTGRAKLWGSGRQANTNCKGKQGGDAALRATPPHHLGELPVELHILALIQLHTGLGQENQLR